MYGMIGQIAGAAINAMNSYQQGKDQEALSKKSLKYWLAAQQNQVQWRVADAIKAGISPLVALGISPSSGPNVSMPYYSEMGDWQRVGQAIGDYIDKTLDPDIKKARQLKMESDGLDNDLKRIQVEKGLRELNKSNTPGSASDIGTHVPMAGIGQIDATDSSKVPIVGRPIPGTIVTDKQIIPMQQIGIEAGVSGKYQWVVGEDDQFEMMITQNVSEPMESDWYAAGSHFVKQGIKAINSATEWILPRAENLYTKEHRDEVRKIRPDHLLKPGWEFRYHPVWRTFKPYRKKGKGQFYQGSYKSYIGNNE